LVENGLQDRTRAVVPSPIGQQTGKFDPGAQLPGSRALTTAQFQRIQEVCLSLIGHGVRHRQQKAGSDAQQLRHVAKIAVRLDPFDGLINPDDAFLEPAYL
jgi:hypothetical protein